MGAALVVGVLAMGAVHTKTALLMALAALAAAAYATWGRAERARAPLLASPFLILGGAALLQLVPLPPVMHRLLNPEGHEAFTLGWRALFEADAPSAWRALSLDPWASADRALRWFALALFALAAANLGGRHTPARAAMGVVALGALSVLAALARALVWPDDPHTYWGVVETVAPIPTLSTFINVNQGASLLGASALCAVWLASRAKQGRWRAFWVAAALATGAACAAFGSLGVFVALAVTGAAWVALVFGARAGAAAVGFLSLAGWSTWRFALSDHATSASTRGGLYEAAARASLDFWPAGAGAGAVDRVIVPYAPAILSGNDAPHVENELLEWALTMGWPITLAVVAAFALMVREAWRLARASGPSWSAPPREHAVAFLATTYVASIAMFHFPFFVMGLGAPLVVFIAAALARKTPGRPRAARVMLALGGLGALTAGALALSGEAPTDRALMGIEEPARALVEARARRLPTEPALYRGAARREGALGNWARAATLTERAFALEPRPRVRVAHALALAQSRAPDERVLELLSPLFSPEPIPGASRLLEPLLTALPDPARRAQLFRAADSRLLAAVTSAVAAREGERAVETFLVELVAARPEDVDVMVALARFYRATERAEVAEFWVRSALARAPSDGALHAQLVRLLQGAGRRDAADAHLWATLERAPDLPELHPLAMGWWMRHMFDDALTDERVRTLKRARASACVGESSRGIARACSLFSAWSLERGGDLERARSLYERASRRFDTPDYLAEFLARHARCLELKRLVVSWAPRDPDDADAARARIERHLKRCYQP